MPTFAVIGSNCFTGCHIVDALLDDPDNRVIGFSRSPEYHPFFLPYKGREGGRFEFRQTDIVRDFPGLMRQLDRSKPEYIIHVAAFSEVALSNERPTEYFDINTLNVVKLCNELRRREYLHRYMHISSAEIFGSCTESVTEETLFNPSTPYAVSKAAADMFLNTLIKNFNFPATIIRSTNVYGKHQQLFKIIPRTAIYLKQSKTIELHGGGMSMKSFVHIRDVVDGLMLTLKKGVGGTFHFSVPSDDTVADVVRTVCELMGRDFVKSTAIVGERLGQDARYTLDCSKARCELGWKPRVDFRAGVKEVVDWVENNWGQIQGESHVYVHKAA